MSTATETIAEEDAPGQLLRELERRQDDVLAQLDLLNEQVEAVLGKLGVRFGADAEGVEECEVEEE